MPEMIRQNRISPLEKVGYGLGDTASNVVFQTIMLWLAYFYTDIFGITAAAMGTLFLVVRIMDAVTDPIMGAVCDRTETRWGKFRPYLLWLCVPFAVLCVATFTTPGLNSAGRLIYAYVTYGLLMLVYTAINIPYCALGGVITPDTRERVSLNSYRFFLATAAGVLVASATLRLVNRLGHGNDQKGFQMAMAVFSLLALLLFLACFSLTKERIIQASTRKFSFCQDVKILLDNDQWRVLAILSFVLLIPLVIRGGMAVYYIKWYAGQEKLITLFLTTGMIAQMFGAACASPLTHRVPKIKAYILIHAVILIVSVLMYFIRRDQVVLMFVLFGIVQFFVQMGSPILWSMMADTADYGEYKSGRRMTGLVFSGTLFTLKMGIALGGAVSGWLLACFGYQELAQTQTDRAVKGIALLFTLIPAGWHLLVIAAVMRYKLTEDRCDEIRTELDRLTGSSNMP